MKFKPILKSQEEALGSGESLGSEVGLSKRSNEDSLQSGNSPNKVVTTSEGPEDNEVLASRVGDTYPIQEMDIVLEGLSPPGIWWES